MSELSALQLVAIHMDTTTLKLISQTPLWDVISSLFLNQHTWYLRAQTCVNFSLQWNSQENWHQVYNILENASTTSPFSRGQALDRQVNGYNSTAVEILLKLGYDPTESNMYTIISAAEYASKKIVMLLLSLPRTNIPNYRMLEALGAASKNEQLEVMKLLIRKISRSNCGDVACIAYIAYIASYMEEAAISNKILAFKLLKNQLAVNFDVILANKMFCIAARSNSLDIMKYLMKIRMVDVNGIECISPLEHAVSACHLEAVSLLLSDSRVRINSDSLASYVECTNRDIKHLILSDARSDQELIYLWLSRAEEYKLEGRTVELIIRRATTRVDKLRPTAMRDIVESITEHLTEAVEGCVNYSRGKFTRENVLEMIINSNTSSSCEDYHYSSLLRELILKRLDIDYYIEWLKCQSDKYCLLHKTREMIISALRSTSQNEHNSKYFTAYRALAILGSEKDKHKILLQLSEERGVTEEGLQLAGALLGAYIGQ